MECKKCDKVAELEEELNDAHNRIASWRCVVAELVEKLQTFVPLKKR